MPIRIPAIFFLACILALSALLSGCTTTKISADERAALRKQEAERRAAYDLALRKRVEASIQTTFGLPDWVERLLAPPAPVVVTPELPPVPEATRPSAIPGVKRLLIVGDSFSVGIGMTMSKSLKGMGVLLLAKGKTSSGLNSPNFYNWQQKLKEFVDSYSPEVVVAMISGNDAHNGSGSEAWRQAYVPKLTEFVKIARSKGSAVYLVGLPTMGDSAYSTRAKVANQAMQEVCETLPDCHYVDSWSLFSDNTGNYTQTKNIGGRVLTLRGKDGVHFTMTGYHLLSDKILNSIAKTYSN